MRVSPFFIALAFGTGLVATAPAGPERALGQIADGRAGEAADGTGWEKAAARGTIQRRAGPGGRFILPKPTDESLKPAEEQRGGPSEEKQTKELPPQTGRNKHNANMRRYRAEGRLKDTTAVERNRRYRRRKKLERERLERQRLGLPEPEAGEQEAGEQGDDTEGEDMPPADGDESAGETEAGKGNAGKNKRLKIDTAPSQGGETGEGAKKPKGPKTPVTPEGDPAALSPHDLPLYDQHTTGVPDSPRRDTQVAFDLPKTPRGMGRDGGKKDKGKAGAKEEEGGGSDSDEEKRERARKYMRGEIGSDGE